MRRRISTGLIAFLIFLAPVAVLAQQRPTPPTRPAAPPATPPAAATGQQEIKLDETTALKADAVESRMSAILANIALMQRQAQDLQTEWSRLLEERKKLLEDAGTKASVEVKDATEWAFDSKGHRYIHGRRAPSR